MVATNWGEIHLVRIDNTDGSHAGRCEIQAGRRSQAAGADYQHSAREQKFLTFPTHFGQDDMP